MCTNRARLLALLLNCFAGLSAQSIQGNRNCDAALVFQKVNSMLGEKAYEQAGKTLDEFQACPTRSTLETFQLGWLYGRARRFDVALKMFSAVPQDVPDRLTHDYAVALSKFELADYQGSINVLKSQESSGLADTKSTNLLAVSYSKLGLYREAYQVLADQIQRDPTDLSLYLNLVTVCADGGDFAKAADVAAQAAQLFPKSADVFILRGAADTLLGHLDQAYADFTTAARLAPQRADARFFLALTKYKEGKYSEAVNILRVAVSEGISDSDVHYLIAECLLKIDPGKPDDALHELDRAVDLNTNSVSARTLRGKLLLETAHPKEAVTDLEFASRRDPDSRAALYNLARAYRALGRTSEAQALFRQLRMQKADTLGEFSDKRLNEALGDKEAYSQ